MKKFSVGDKIKVVNYEAPDATNRHLLDGKIGIIEKVNFIFYEVSFGDETLELIKAVHPDTTIPDDYEYKNFFFSGVEIEHA